MRPFSKCALVAAAFAASSTVHAADLDLSASASQATNQLGVDLYHQLCVYNDDNICLSPYSIQSALAMTFAGADGETRAEMAHVLRFPTEGELVHASFATLQASLLEMSKKAAQIAEQSKKKSGPSEPITLSIANHLFAQRGYDFRDAFQALVKKFYGAPFETLDFKKDPEAARAHINKWVADQTRDKIRDLVPQGGIKELTRLVLANAVYLKAPWASEFNEALTKPKPFHLLIGDAINVPTMEKVGQFGYAKVNGYSVIAVPYSGGELQFLILLPDDTLTGFRDLQRVLNAELLAECTKLRPQDVDLELPKFKIEPPTIPLAENLEGIGMKTAFDDPQGSANFDRMSPRRPDRYLAISNVFHKTFIAVDEKGTEAAAATGVVMMELTARFEKPTEPIHVKVDRPFLYAIQHVPSRACLFIGRVTDSR
jgi:serpin B